MDDSAFYSFVEKKDTGDFARFYDKFEKTSEFNENGLPVFANRTRIEIRVRDSHDVVDARATDEHKRRFPQEYALYLAKKEKTRNGTPLSMFAFLNAAQVQCCEFRGIFTVEELAALDEMKASEIGLLDEMKLAQEFIKVSSNNKELAEVTQENKRLKAEIERLKEQVKALKG